MTQDREIEFSTTVKGGHRPSRIVVPMIMMMRRRRGRKDIIFSLPIQSYMVISVLELNPTHVPLSSVACKVIRREKTCFVVVGFSVQRRLAPRTL